MEFGRRKRPKIPYSKDDIKKAIKDANARLRKANDSLDKDIAAKRKSLDSIVKEISSNENELKAALSAIEGAKKDAARASTEATKERIEVSKIKKQLAEALSREDSAQSNLNKLTKESEVLSKKVDKMNDSLAIASALKEELKILKSDKKIEINNLDELNGEADGIKKELSQLRTNTVKKKKDHKELLAGLDAETEIKQKSLEMVDSKYEIKMAELNTKFSSLEESLKDKEQEVETMDSLIKKKEGEFIGWESKCRQAEHLLMKAKDLADSQIERSKKEIDRQQEGAKRWKIGFLEEIARVKLKKKIEKLDMAGLKEAFNV